MFKSIVLWDCVREIERKISSSFELNMEFSDSGNNAMKSRTKRITKCSWVKFVLLFLLAQLNQSNSGHIGFDDIETLWLKNVAVQLLPQSIVQNRTMPLLKVTGMATVDIEDGVRIKGTLSPTHCLGNETDLQIINDTPPNNNIQRTTDLDVSLDNFNFKQQPAAYLCIKTKNDDHFQHMGAKSKFSK